MINLFPSDDAFAAAEHALNTGTSESINNQYFQHYVALIATCVQRGHCQIVDIMAQVAPVVGAENAVHIPWFIQILSGPACDVHLWDWDGDLPKGHFYGPGIELKDELRSSPPSNA